MHAVRHTELLSAEEYLRREELSATKHEFVAGCLYAMSGANNRHNRIATNLMIELGPQLKGSPCQLFNSDAKVRIQLSQQVRFYYPDAMVVCQANSDSQTFQERPTLVVEVLSPCTRRTDLTEKKEAYLSISSLQYLLFVEQDLPRVTLLSRSGHSFVEEIFAGLEAVVPLQALNAQVALSELYARVQFEEEAL